MLRSRYAQCESRLSKSRRARRPAARISRTRSTRLANRSIKTSWSSSERRCKHKPRPGRRLKRASRRRRSGRRLWKRLLCSRSCSNRSCRSARCSTSRHSAQTKNPTKQSARNCVRTGLSRRKFNASVESSSFCRLTGTRCRLKARQKTVILKRLESSGTKKCSKRESSWRIDSRRSNAL